MTVNRGRGIIDTPSNHSVEETVEKLKGILQAKGVTLFALVDHSAEGEKVGIKILIWEDREGKVWVSYNSPTYLQERHGLPYELLQNIAAVETLAAAVAE